MMFTGTNQQQDTRFSDKEKKLLKQMKFGDCLNQRVDMDKVKLDVLRPWISRKITEYLHIEDDVVVEFVYNQLEDDKFPCPKKMQINMTGFLNGKNARQFMDELWALLLSAQESETGIPEEFIQQKKDEIFKREEENKLHEREKNDMDNSSNRFSRFKPKRSRDSSREPSVHKQSNTSQSPGPRKQSADSTCVPGKNDDPTKNRRSISLDPECPGKITSSKQRSREHSVDKSKHHQKSPKPKEHSNSKNHAEFASKGHDSTDRRSDDRSFSNVQAKSSNIADAKRKRNRSRSAESRGDESASRSPSRPTKVKRRSRFRNTSPRRRSSLKESNRKNKRRSDSSSNFSSSSRTHSRSPVKDSSKDYEIHKSENSVQKKRHYRNNKESPRSESIERIRDHQNDRFNSRRSNSWNRSRSPRRDNRDNRDNRYSRRWSPQPTRWNKRRRSSIRPMQRNNRNRRSFSRDRNRKPIRGRRESPKRERSRDRTARQRKRSTSRTHRERANSQTRNQKRKDAPMRERSRSKSRERQERERNRHSTERNSSTEKNIDRRSLKSDKDSSSKKPPTSNKQSVDIDNPRSSLTKAKSDLKEKSNSTVTDKAMDTNKTIESTNFNDARFRQYSSSLSRTPSPFLKKNEKVEQIQSIANKQVDKLTKKQIELLVEDSSDESDSSASGIEIKKKKKDYLSSGDSSDNASRPSIEKSNSKQKSKNNKKVAKLKRDRSTSVEVRSSKTKRSKYYSISKSSDDIKNSKKSKLLHRVSDDSSSESEAEEKKKKTKKSKKNKRHKKHKKHKKQSRAKRTSDDEPQTEEERPPKTNVNDDLEKQLRERALKSMKKQNSLSD